MDKIAVARPEDGKGAVALPATLDAGLASPLRDALARDCRTLPGLEIDGSAVESIATPGIQILVAAGLTFDSEGRPFRITQPSTPLKSAFADLGLRSVLERWSVE